MSSFSKTYSHAESSIRRVQVALAVAVLSMAIVVILGWLLRNVAIVQLYPDFAPMQFNTALGFLLLGLAMLPLISKRPPLALGLGIALTLLGLGTVLQYVTGMDFGIDELLVDPFTMVRTSHPGRMAPNTALCFTLSGLAIISLVRGRNGLCASLASIVMGMGLVSCLGYMSGVEEAYGWGDLTRMALHTSIGFVVGGIGLTLYIICPGRSFEMNQVSMATVVGVLGLTCTIATWQAMVAERNRDILSELDILAQRTGTNFSLQVDGTLGALHRLAARTVRDDPETGAESRWDFDGAAYFDHITSLSSLIWFDDQRHTTWLLERIPGAHSEVQRVYARVAADNARSNGYDGTFQIALTDASIETTTQIVSAVGLTSAQGVQGVLVAFVDPVQLFQPTLAGMSDVLSIQVKNGDTTVFESPFQSHNLLVSAYTARTEVHVSDSQLQFILTATENFVHHRASRVATVVLIGGVLATGLLIVILYLTIASVRARNAFRYHYSRYQLVTNHVPVMIAAFDDERRLTFANGPFLRWMNASEEVELLGRDAPSLFQHHDDEIMLHFDAALAGETSEFELSIPQESAGEQNLMFQFVPQFGTDGLVDNVFALVFDVTERCRAEHLLTEHAARLDRFTNLAVGREEKMIALKREINEFLNELGRPPQYRIVSMEDSTPETKLLLCKRNTSP